MAPAYINTITISTSSEPETQASAFVRNSLQEVIKILQLLEQLAIQFPCLNMIYLLSHLTTLPKQVALKLIAELADGTVKPALALANEINFLSQTQAVYNLYQNESGYFINAQYSGALTAYLLLTSLQTYGQYGTQINIVSDVSYVLADYTNILLASQPDSVLNDMAELMYAIFSAYGRPPAPAISVNAAYYPHPQPMPPQPPNPPAVSVNGYVPPSSHYPLPGISAFVTIPASLQSLYFNGQSAMSQEHPDDSTLIISFLKDGVTTRFDLNPGIWLYNFQFFNQDQVSNVNYAGLASVKPTIS